MRQKTQMGRKKNEGIIWVRTNKQGKNKYMRQLNNKTEGGERAEADSKQKHS